MKREFKKGDRVLVRNNDLREWEGYVNGLATEITTTKHLTPQTMKVTLEFNLPEQQERFDDLMNGAKWKYVVREIDEHMRELIKWNSENLDDSQLLVVRQLRSMLLQYLEQENLRLHE